MFRLTRFSGDDLRHSELAARTIEAWHPHDAALLLEHSDLDTNRLPDGPILFAAGCWLWWTHTPPYAGRRLGVIGHCSAATEEAGPEILRQACSDLAAQGCTLAVGPMDGSTWRPYRLITKSGAEPPFFLEPNYPGCRPEFFAVAGFTPLAHYYSAVITDLAADEARLPALSARVEQEGISLRNLRIDQLDVDLRAVFSVTCASFADNLLYMPIREEQFLILYHPLVRLVRPDFVFLAEKAGRVIGFLFALPNHAQQPPIDTLIIKTMAVHPDYQGTGLGSLLMARCHVEAHRRGFRRVIHALMHEDSHSRKISRHTAEVFRRYTLFARPLEPRP